MNDEARYSSEILVYTNESGEIKLDCAVDRLNRKNPFPSDKDRLELLFERYRGLLV